MAATRTTPLSKEELKLHIIAASNGWISAKESRLGESAKYWDEYLNRLLKELAEELVKEQKQVQGAQASVAARGLLKFTPPAMKAAAGGVLKATA